MSVANSSARPGTEPTIREIEVLRAWAEAGDAPHAAARLGMTVDGVRAMLANVRSRGGVKTTAEAATFFLDRTGVR